MLLNGRGVEHNTDGSAKSAGRKRGGELGTDSTTVTVDAGDLAPDNAALLALLIGLAGTVDVGDALAKIPIGIDGVADMLQRQDGGGRVLESLAALISEVTSLNVQSTHRRG